MKIVLRVALLAIVAALGYWLWTVFFPGPEKLIQRKVTSLATTVTFNAEDSALIRAAKAASVVDYFTTAAEISVELSEMASHTLSGREEIRETALAGFTNVRALNVQFLDVTVRMGADRQIADVNCTAKVSAGDNKDYDLRELHFQFKKVDGNWLISRLETLKTLS